jgi:hypothetical protein
MEALEDYPFFFINFYHVMVIYPVSDFIYHLYLSDYQIPAVIPRFKESSVTDKHWSDREETQNNPRPPYGVTYFSVDIQGHFTHTFHPIKGLFIIWTPWLPRQVCRRETG